MSSSRDHDGLRLQGLLFIPPCFLQRNRAIVKSREFCNSYRCFLSVRAKVIGRIRVKSQLRC